MNGEEMEQEKDTVQPKRRSHKKLWIWLGSIVGVFLIAAGITATYFARHAEPILRKRIIDTLSARFHSPVELDEFHISASHGLGVTGKGLRVMYIVKTNEAGKDREEPMLSVGSFDFRTNFKGLWKSPTHIGEVHVSQLQIHLPPKEQREGQMMKTSDNAKPTNEEPKESIIVDRIVVDDAVLVMETAKPGKEPTEFDIHKLVLKDVGRTKPFDFDATLVNPKPIGDIHTTGHFGPWDADDPHQTPLDGKYTFENVDMDSIKGIGGHMSASGVYGGVLEEITSDGETHMKDFSLDVSDHPMPLRTKYHAIIDGTSGDVLLQPVEAWLGSSYFICTGHVVKVPKPAKGHDIYLSVNMPKARIEDMLYLATKTEPVLMRGAFRMKTELHIPNGDVSVSKKIELTRGHFIIQNAIFSSDKIQDKVDTLSMRAQGRPHDANIENADTVQSDMSGDFEVKNSKITVNNLLYTMPGAQVVANGVYGMTGDLFEFHGKVRTKAKLSQMTTSWKSMLLKPVDPFFSKHHAGAEIPFKISGTKDEPHFGVEFHQDEKKVRDTSNMEKPK